MPTFMDFPVEVLLMIIEEGLTSSGFNLKDLRALVMTNRTLRDNAKSYLYRYDAERLGSFAVIWAADKGSTGVMELALANKGNPNARFYRDLKTAVPRSKLPSTAPLDDKAVNRIESFMAFVGSPAHTDDLPNGLNSDIPRLWKAGQEGFRTPLHLSLIRDHCGIAKMLLSAGASTLALCSHICGCSQNSLRPSIKDISDVGVVTSSAYTAMHIALCHGNSSIARLLLDHGASMVVARLLLKEVPECFLDVDISASRFEMTESEIAFMLASSRFKVRRGFPERMLSGNSPRLMFSSSTFLMAASICEKKASAIAKSMSIEKHQAATTPQDLGASAESASTVLAVSGSTQS